MSSTTDRAPAVPLKHFKQTKIMATLGPATHSYEAVEQLIKAGVNGMRLNFSHGTTEERTQQLKWVREAAKASGKPVAIIQDLQGPKMRLGDFEGVVTVQKGQSLRFGYNANYAEEGIIPTQYDLSRKVKRGERLYIHDGKVHTVIISVKGGVVHTTAENEGILIKRKGMNLPDTDFGGDIITKKDRTDLAFGSTQDVDYVALSFVQTAHDIEKLRTILHNLGSTAHVIAKVETKAAVDNLEEIIQASDAVMVARGDLAIETNPESVPIVQRQIVALGLKYATPTIIATQMLASMTEMLEPTRAEVSDIATAVMLGVDCLMLSDETATGRYPVEAVQLMKRVVLYTQEHDPLTLHFPPVEEYTRQSAISAAIISLASDIQAKAIVAETKSGATALQIAACRPEVPIIAVTPDRRVAQRLSIVYGTKGYVRPVNKYAATKLTDWLREHKLFKAGDIVITTSCQYPGVVGTTDTIKVRVLK